jgi:copper chaperone
VKRHEEHQGQRQPAAQPSHRGVVGVGVGQRGATMTIVSTRQIAVTGMTCDHCARAVRAEISRLPGVTGVDVDVAAGTVCVSGDPLPGDVPLREAVEEAGYEFAG